ncbi:MAG TPA: RagB/SusD family nutrient uptake outer membrane protein, partial [Mucilaginibacter sp.]
MLVFSSCKKSGFLDQKNLSQITEQQIFSDSLNSWQYINSRYNNVSYSWEITRWGQGGVESASDEAQSQLQLTQLQTYWQTGAISPSNVGSDPVWGTTYQQVRAVNIFLKDRKNIPVTQRTKDLWTGQARFLRAWYLATLLKNFGGFPMVRDTIFDANANINIPRSSYED